MGEIKTAVDDEGTLAEEGHHGFAEIGSSFGDLDVHHDDVSPTL